MHIVLQWVRTPTKLATIATKAQCRRVSPEGGTISISIISAREEVWGLV